MNIGSFIVVFVIIWWLVLFLTLPIGIDPEQKPEAGNMKGAPKKPAMKIKLLVTTIIAVLITCLYFYALEVGWFSLQDVYKG